MASLLQTLLNPSNLSTGIMGLASLFGNHQASASMASTPLAMIKNGINVGDNARMVAQVFASSNPDAAATALAIANDPAKASALVGTLEQEIASHSDSILTQLSQAVRLQRVATSLGVTV
jgi:hypothetical protein